MRSRYNGRQRERAYSAQLQLTAFQPSGFADIGSDNLDDVGSFDLATLVDAITGDKPAPSSSTATTQTDGTQTPWSAYVPALKEFFFGKGSRTDAAVAQAKVADLEKKVASSAWPLKGLYESQLAKARAELLALQVQADEEQSAVQAQQALRVTLVGLGVAATVAALAYAVVQVQHARVLEAQRHRG